MDFRLSTEPRQGASYLDLLQVAQRAETAGYDAFFRSDHYLKMGAVSGQPGPTDAWVTLGALARETERIRLGTLVTAATFRLPGPLAISVAQVDQMSGGRVELGLGSGWYADEHRAYGIPFPPAAERFDRYAEQLEIVSGLLRTRPGELFSFSGQYYQLTDSPALPKPVQRPGPPIIVGGLGKKRTPELAARFADEFNVPFANVDDAAAQFERVDAACAHIGRDASELVRSASLVVAVGRDEAEFAKRALATGYSADDRRATDRAGVAGSPGEAVDRLGRWRERTGITRIYLQLLDLADLDHIELIASEVMPQLA